MQRYFFHVYDDIVSIDEEGQLAEDIRAAHEIALESARDLVCAQVARGYLNLDNYIVIANEAGEEIARLAFREAFEIRSERGSGR